MTDFDAWFMGLSGTSMSPHDWQRELGRQTRARSQLIRVPTGMGKTLGVLAAWSWHCIHRQDPTWPRRLVWCLPMRVLVEQTEAVVRTAFERVGLLWNGLDDHTGKVGVHLLMGGADPGGEWSLFPEERAVLIGTQDMLISRALNRGYASGRARWPLEFGLLGHDALWVMDEVQLMDVGLATSAQLQAYHDADVEKGMRPRLTWWMSATLQPGWLRSVDTAPRHDEWIQDPCIVRPEHRDVGLGAIRKTIAKTSVPAASDREFADRVLREHAKVADGEYGRITLVVCNTVDRACRAFDALRRTGRATGIELVHSRFRPAERRRWREAFLQRDACKRGVDRIIVATQVVEAGVDVSAGCVVTELAPWPSLVQRFGRCARYGGSGHVLVVDRGRDEKSAPPYSSEELEAAWDALSTICETGGGVATGQLDAFEESLDEAARRRLYPYAPKHLLLRRELDELFDTTPDLTGADLDISRFIRSGDERDLHVFWTHVPPDRKGEVPHAPSARRRPAREELCGVPFLRARDWLCGAETSTNRKPKLRAGVRAWAWDWLSGEWVVVERAHLTPGRVVCVATDSGGYQIERGFDPDSDVPVVEVDVPPLAPKIEAQLQADESEGAEDLSAGAWKTIACHVGEVAELASSIATTLGLSDDLRRVLVLAARWHDLGKAHPAFQGAIRRSDRPQRDDLAKAPDDAWLRPPGSYRTRDDKDSRRGLRHELASALALFAVLQRHEPRHPALLGPWLDTLKLLGHSVDETSPHGEAPTACEKAILECSSDEFDLLAYLVAAHHGKVRVSLHAAPIDQEYRGEDERGLPIRGVCEGDELPPVKLDESSAPLPSLRLSLEPANLGLSLSTGRSWRERTIGLLDRFGPGALAWLEALLIAADRRASKLDTADPSLSTVQEGS